MQPMHPMPDLRSRTGVVASALVLAATGLGALVTGLSLPIDDFWLSLASARELHAGAPLDRPTPATWTPMVEGPINPQWGAQLVLGIGEAVGPALVVNSLLIGGGMLVLSAMLRRQASVVATSAAMVVAIGILAPHLLARAQSFSILLLPVALLLLALRPVPRWLPVAYGLLMVAWANLHGAFVIGQVAAVAWLVGSVLDRRRSRDQPSAVPTLAITAAVALAAPLANPAGFALMAYAYAQPGLEVVRSISVEWQLSWPWIPVATLFWATLALVVIGRVLRRGAVTPSEAIFLGITALLAATSIRHIPWFGFAAAPVIARDVDAALAARPRLARAIGLPAPPLRGRPLVVGLGAALLILAALQPLRPALPQSVGRVTPDAPVLLADALDAALPSGASARILNEQVWGGYLAYRFGGRVQTAMDGRLEIRDRATWAAYFGLLHGDGDPAATLAAEGVTWAAVQHDRVTLVRKLQKAGWIVIARAPDGLLLRTG